MKKSLFILALSLTPYAQAMDKTFPEALKQVATGKQYIAVGDRHDKASIADEFFKRETYDALKASGVKHVFLETPIENQKFYDAYSNGKLTREQFIKKNTGTLSSDSIAPEDQKKLFGHHADLLDWAKQDGIKVHCANERHLLIKEMAKDPKVMADYKANAPMDLNERVSLQEYLLHNNSVTLPSGDKVAPLTDDRPLAKFIQAKAGPDKAAIFYGDRHLSTAHGVDEMLGKDKVAKVELTDGMGDRLLRSFNNLSTKWDGSYKPDPSPADLKYDVSSGSVSFGTPVPMTVDMSRLKIEPEAAPAPAAKVTPPPARPKAHHAPK